jgi:hypothetical protein
MKSFFKHKMSLCMLLVMILIADYVSANNIPDPPPPPCSAITRQVSNAKSNNSDPWDDIGVVMNLLNTGNASWLFEAGAVFQENANGTGSLTGVIHQFGYTNRRLQVNIQFSDRSWTGPFFNQTGVPTTGWYVYNTWTGTMTGLSDLAGGAINMSYHMNSGIQAGVGANQVWSPTDMTANGAGTWFEWSVLSQPTNTEYSFLNYSNVYNTDVNILLSGTPTPPCDPPVGPCDNVTSGGFIGSNQTICVGATPALLTNVTSPAGGSGALEFVWLKSTTGCPDNASQMIAGSNSINYQPGPLTQTTYFRRCARRAGCTEYIGESNCITITVVPDVTPPTISGCPGNQTVTATGNCAVVTWTAPTASDNCSTPTLTSNYNSGYCFPVGTTTVIYTATDVAGLTKTCTFTVVVDPAPCAVSINISGKACNNNGTPNNPNDDTYTFVMTVTGAGTVSSTWSGGYSNPYLGAFAFGPTPYNTPITLGPFPAGPFTSGNTVPPVTLPNGLDIQINVQDSQNPACAQSTTVTSPGPCSNGTQPNCDDVTIIAAPGQITIGGLTAPIVMVQIFNSNWATVLNCAGNCNTPVQVVSNLTAGTYYVKVTFLTAGWSQICLKEVYIDVPPPTNPCDNVTSGGTIGSNQSYNCGPFDPAAIVEITAPSGGSGALEYLWLSSTTGCPNSATQAIAGANGASYDPGILSQTTYFVRWSRRAGCTEWTTGGSNCVIITVTNDNTPPTISGCPSNMSLTTSGTCSVATWTSPVASDNCGTPVLTSNYNSGHCFPVGTTTVIYTATDAAGLTATCTFTVTVTPPPCVERVVTNNTLCNGSTAYGLWINGNYYTTSANVRFRQYSDGTATLTGNFTRTGETVAVNLTLTGFSDTGNPYYELCVNSGGSAWDFYTDFSGTLSINGTSYAVTPRGPHLFQMGTGANLNEPSQFGASTWFFLNNTIHGDFNFRLGPAGECTTTTVCDNVTNGGTISKSCVNNEVSLNSVTLPSGGSGTIEYVWMKGTSGCSVSSMTAVPNSNSATLTIASPTATTYYIRCSRRGGCTSYDGESNCITVYANECAPPVCNNVTNGGTISKSCVNNQVSLNSVTLPSGGSGTIEYVWMKGTSGCSVSSMTAVANSNSATLTIASPTATTYYIRCSRRAGCTSYDGESNCITVNANECAPVVCNNVTNGGTISKSCVNGQVSLNSVTLPTGGSGTIEYVWMKGTSSCSVSSMTAVANSNSATLTVASPSVTTYYIRCARRAGCTTYIGESNCITVNANECSSTNCTGNILFVASSTSLNGSDLALKNRLISLGYTVTVKSHSYASSSDANGKVLVIISESVTSSTVNSKFKHVTVPVMVLEPLIYDDMCMTGSTNNGAINITSMYINTGHPIATGLSGNTSVYTSSQSAGWGTPSSAAAVIAYNTSYTYKKYVFAYEAGASMSGYTAPAKRIGFFVGSTCATYLTANGWKLFDQSVKWATGCPIGGQNLQAEVPVSDFNATRDFRQSRIEWASNTGYRNDYAVVERLNEVTSTFEAIDYIETGSPDNHPQVFTAYDENPNEGDNFYRLKLVFTDGTEEYSEVKKVNFDGLDKVNIFPNPAVDVLMIDLAPYEGKQVTIFLYNQLGQPMESIEVDAATAEPRSIDISNYISGTYLVRVTTEGRRDVTKQVTINR